MIGKDLQGMIDQGSQNYVWTNPAAINVADPMVWVDIGQTFPQAKLYEPLDSLELINNSSAAIRLYLNSMTEGLDIPAFMIKPLMRRSIRRIGILNTDAVQNINIGEIIAGFRRLPKQVTATINVGG